MADWVPRYFQLATWPVERAREGLLVGLVLLDRPGGRVVNDGHQDLLIISWEGDVLPYRRLRFDVPSMGLHIDARTLEELQ